MRFYLSCLQSSSPLRVAQAETQHIMPGRGLVAYRRATEDLQLSHIRDTPAWMRAQCSEHITTGYRVGYTWPKIFRSLFTIHNETANVWSHLLGFLLMLFLGYHAFANVLDVSFVTYTVFVSFFASCLWCLGASTVFHLCWHHSPGVHKTTLFCDHFGISALITGSMVPLVVFLFTCHPTLQLVYSAVIATVGGFSLVMPWTHVFHTWYWRRLAVFLATVFAGIVPAAHALLIIPRNDVTAPVFFGFLLVLMQYGVGMAIYILQVPECWYPGRFDFWWNSHNIWHICVLAACVTHFYTCLGIYQRHELPHC